VADLSPILVRGKAAARDLQVGSTSALRRDSGPRSAPSAEPWCVTVICGRRRMNRRPLSPGTTTKLITATAPGPRLTGRRPDIRAFGGTRRPVQVGPTKSIFMSVGLELEQGTHQLHISPIRATRVKR